MMTQTQIHSYDLDLDLATGDSRQSDLSTTLVI